MIPPNFPSYINYNHYSHYNNYNSNPSLYSLLFRHYNPSLHSLLRAMLANIARNDTIPILVIIVGNYRL